MKIDEGLIGVGQEICNERDDDCDRMVDEGVKNACGFCGPAPMEVCDGADNDCDGNTDEGFAPDCLECMTPMPEVCDGLDNDCDDKIDEGVKNACGQCGVLPQEVCDEMDNDCDGDVDENVKNACGACGFPPMETCDGEDNDCDGTPDEGELCMMGEACRCGGCVKPCDPGTQECPGGDQCVDGFCLPVSCIPGAVTPADAGVPNTTPLNPPTTNRTVDAGIGRRGAARIGLWLRF